MTLEQLLGMLPEDLAAMLLEEQRAHAEMRANMENARKVVEFSEDMFAALLAQLKAEQRAHAETRDALRQARSQALEVQRCADAGLAEERRELAETRAELEKVASIRDEYAYAVENTRVCTLAQRKVLDACGALDEGLLLIVAQRYPELIPLLEAVMAAREKP